MPIWIASWCSGQWFVASFLHILIASHGYTQVTAHLIDLAGYHYQPVRERGLTVLTTLIHVALKHPRTPPIHVKSCALRIFTFDLRISFYSANTELAASHFIATSEFRALRQQRRDSMAIRLREASEKTVMGTNMN